MSVRWPYVHTKDHFPIFALMKISRIRESVRRPIYRGLCLTELVHVAGNRIRDLSGVLVRVVQVWLRQHLGLLSSQRKNGRSSGK